MTPNKKHEEIFSKRYDKILQVSREKYSNAKVKVEDKINKTMYDIEKQEIYWEKKKADMEAKKKEEKAKKHAEMLDKQAKEREKRE